MDEKKKKGKGQLSETQGEVFYIREEGLVLPEDMEEGLREPIPIYVDNSKRQGEFTVEDYYALPDDCRCELIDGVLYDMAAPGTIHQAVSGRIYARIFSYIEMKGGKCMVFAAPMAVQLDMDNRTMVEPDVFVVCDRDKLYENVLWGAPDFVIEILSKSTAKKDRILKRRKYREAGVREYWMVDSEQKRVVVYLFGETEREMIYGFEDSIPIGIFDGECEIHFAELYESIRFLYGKGRAPEQKLTPRKIEAGIKRI